jgi:signal transduction histidine kinase
MIAEHHREYVAQEVQRAIASAGSFEVEYQFQSAFGEIKWILERGQTIVNEAGIVVSLDGILFDVTVRKLAEEKLQQTNADLQASQQQLQELNASKDKFFSIISHDLRSPFNGIIGSTEVLLNSIDVMDKPDITDGIRDVHKTLKALYEFIENLLTWSRAQTKGLVYAPVPLQLYEVAQAVTFLLKENTAKKSILVTIDVSEDLVVFADYNMVRSVLHNLFSNAIKFTPIGGSISIQAFSKEKMVHIAVQDSGVGMSESAIAKLFRIDVHHTTLGTNNEKGTGLGLILCKEMIERNGGTISIRSKEGEGSTFECTLPLALS